MQTIKVKSVDRKEKLQQQHVFRKLDSKVWSSCFQLINDELLIERNVMKMFDEFSQEQEEFLMMMAMNLYN